MRFRKFSLPFLLCAILATCCSCVLSESVQEIPKNETEVTTTTTTTTTKSPPSPSTTTSTTTAAPAPPTPPANAKLVEVASLSRRPKRQQDASTAFVGISVQKNAQADDYVRIKAVAGRVRRSNGRRRRSLMNYRAQNVWTDFDEHLWASSIPRRPSAFELIIRKHHRRPRKKPILRRKPIVVHQHHHHKILVPVYVPPTTTTPAPPRLLTRTQETFNVINQSPALSSNLRQEYVREFNSSVVGANLAAGNTVDPGRVNAGQRLLVVRETGITCNDVCDGSQGDDLGYGTIGICTPKFCQCDFNLAQYTRFDCPPDMVFDPILLRCNSPFNVLLCNDEEYQEEQVKPKHVTLIKPVLTVPTLVKTKFLVPPPVLSTVAPLSPVVLTGHHGHQQQSFLTNSLGNSGIIQNYPSPTQQPTSYFVGAGTTFASPISSTVATPTYATQTIAGQQFKISGLSPSELQAVAQIGSRQVLPSDSYNIQQLLQSSQLQLQHNPAHYQFSSNTQHGSPHSVSSAQEHRVVNQGQFQNVRLQQQQQQYQQQAVLNGPTTVQQQQQRPLVLAQQVPHTAAYTLLSQSGLLNHMMQLTPGQMAQLTQLVQVLASNNQYAGGQTQTQVSTGQTLRL